jgi:hypothetical protein
VGVARGSDKEGRSIEKAAERIIIKRKSDKIDIMAAKGYAESIHALLEILDDIFFSSFSSFFLSLLFFTFSLIFFPVSRFNISVFFTFSLLFLHF